MLSDQQGLQNKQRRRAERVYWVAYCKLGCAEIDRMSKKIGAFRMGRGKGLLRNLVNRQVASCGWRKERGMSEGREKICFVSLSLKNHFKCFAGYSRTDGGSLNA